MDEPERTTVRLSPYATYVAEDAVESGEFASTDAFVEAAVRSWQERKEDELIEAMGGIEVVRRLVAEGEKGPFRPLDIDRLIAEARRQLNDRRS